MKTFEVWSEGYRATGESGTAMLHGKFEGETFKDAVIAYKDTVTDLYSRSCIDVENLKFWGCRFFDNELDARKSFG